MHAIGLAVWIIIMVQACAGFCSTRSPYFLGAVATLGSPATRGAPVAGEMSQQAAQVRC